VRFAHALGREANVHFIDDAVYYTADGEVHAVLARWRRRITSDSITRDVSA
jgi:hypothetical protein